MTSSLQLVIHADLAGNDFLSFSKSLQDWNIQPCVLFPSYVTITASSQNADRTWISNSQIILNPNRTEQLQIAVGKYFEEKAKPVVHHLTGASVEVCQSSADSLTSAYAHSQTWTYVLL